MTVKYKTVITKAGAEKLAAATLPNGKKVNFAAMAVGDGGGTLPTPDPNQTKLVKEVWRHALNKISQDKKHKNYVVAELVIPPETGGFWLREMGLYDDTGALIAVGNMAESYKPELAEGSGRAQTLRMVIMVSDIDTVELSIDTTLVMATQDYVDDKLAEHEQSRRHPDATLKEKGFTQLSSATDSTSETLAATPNAVRAVYDFASAKYTAQDATTKQKGIVQLSSATDSTSEVLAATPKAVKTVNDELTSFKKSLGTAAAKDIVTSARDTTAGRVLTVGYAGLGGYGSTNMLNAAEAKEPLPNGFYGVQTDATYGNAALISFGYDSGSQVHIIAKQGGQAPLIGLAGSNPKGEFGAWGKIYTEFQKPTAADVGALPLAGGTMTGIITTSSDGRGSFASQLGSKAPVYQEINTVATSEYWPIVKQKYIQGNSAWSMGVLVKAGRLQIYYSAPDNANDKNFSFQTDGQLILPNYANFDARYYTKAQSDAGYMPKTGAYTKAESDGRYPLKTATVIDVRQGSAGTIILTRNGWNYVPAGCAFTGWYVEGDAPVGDTIQYKPMQININGAWRTISG